MAARELPTGEAEELELEAPDHLIGEVLANRYQIEERLGEGAMGAVYRAKHVKVGRPFAVKVLHARLLEDEKVAHRFEREAELAGRLRHPNVVGVVDVGETSDGLRYMVMDFAEGPDLATLLNEAPMSAARVMHLTRQLLEGLFHAHEQGLIHRDFKPENVIVERDVHGQELPRIVDFGIAILREGGESPSAQGRLTTNGLVLGTPHYMAPEQAVADPIDHRIDLFALGIVVYEMLSGKLPFDGTGAEVARANLLLDPPLISQRVPRLEVDPLLEAFARRLMQKKRDLRPATAKIARQLLDLIDKDRPAAAAALGVPLNVVREPATTQPLAQEKPPTPTGEWYLESAQPNDTDAVPAMTPSADLMTVPVVRKRDAASTERPAPPQATVWRGDDRATEDLEAPPKRKRLALIIGGAAVTAAAILIALLALGGKRDEPPAPAPAPPVAVTEAPVVAPKQVVVDPPAVIEPAHATIEAPPKSAEPPPKAIGRGRPPKSAPPKTITERKSEQVAAKAEPVETGDVSAEKLAALYGSVGAKLHALDQAHAGTPEMNDLWNRYRRYRFAEETSTPERRRSFSHWLTAINVDAGAIK